MYILLQTPYLIADGPFDEHGSRMPPLTWNNYKPLPQTKEVVGLLEQIALN